MVLYFARRLGQALLVLWLAYSLVFMAVQLLPSDPVTIFLSADAPVDQATIDAMKAQYGYDQPLLVQYFSQFGQLLRGDVGYSLDSGQSVATRIGGAAGSTLASSAFVAAVVLAVALVATATSSARGRKFAAENAEATFLFAPHVDYVARQTASIRALEAAGGRAPGDVKIFGGLSFVTGSTEDEVVRKQAEYDEYLDLHTIIAHVGGGIGVDLGGLPLDTPLGEINTEGARGVLEAAIASVPGGNPTVGDLARYRAKAQQIAGTPERIVDELERWQDAGIDGVNIINQIIPGSYTDFIQGVLPELQRRGLAQTEYSPGTLREKIFGRGPRLEPTHPATRFRGAFGDLSAAATVKPIIPLR